jgi:signal transduction histidine kinase
MNLYKVGGLLFTPPLDRQEFQFCVNLFGTPPQKLVAEGGFEAILKRAGLRSIRVVSVAYQRVTGDEPAVASDKAKSHFFSAEPVVARIEEAVKPKRPAMLDLSAALNGSAPLGTDDSPDLPESAPETRSAQSRRERSAALAAMLRDAAAALERDQGSEAPQTEMSGTLDKIREALSEMAAGSRRDISTLASQVDEDSKTIASIESAARRRGIGLKLTRGELVQRYAELNQEIVQPLTVSSGVIDLLSSGKAGDLSESQLELLKMAAESVDRVNQLVSHMSSISGLPESFTPDREVISDSYR